MNATINANPPITAEQARAALRVVVDPEVGVNIVDLGLVYHIEVAPDQIKVALTMTSPFGPCQSSMSPANAKRSPSVGWM